MQPSHAQCVSIPRNKSTKLSSELNNQTSENARSIDRATANNDGRLLKCLHFSNESHVKVCTLSRGLLFKSALPLGWFLFRRISMLCVKDLVSRRSTTFFHHSKTRLPLSKKRFSKQTVSPITAFVIRQRKTWEISWKTRSQTTHQEGTTESRRIRGPNNTVKSKHLL